MDCSDKDCHQGTSSIGAGRSNALAVLATRRQSATLPLWCGARRVPDDPNGSRCAVGTYGSCPGVACSGEWDCGRAAAPALVVPAPDRCSAVATTTTERSGD
jgi:hypothetical protein